MTRYTHKNEILAWLLYTRHRSPLMPPNFHLHQSLAPPPPTSVPPPFLLLREKEREKKTPPLQLSPAAAHHRDEGVLVPSKQQPHGAPRDYDGLPEPAEELLRHDRSLQALCDGGAHPSAGSELGNQQKRRQTESDAWIGRFPGISGGGVFAGCYAGWTAASSQCANRRSPRNYSQGAFTYGHT